MFRVRPDDENFNSLLEMFSQRSREPVIAQRYLPEVRKGDKRIILIDGKAVGVINRVPAEGEARSNMHVGGVAVKDTLTKRDKELCEIIGPELARRGLLFVGIDVIGDYLTEINVTSPTGLQQINRFDGVSLEAQIWDRIEVRYPGNAREDVMIRRTFLALALAGAGRHRRSAQDRSFDAQAHRQGGARGRRGEGAPGAAEGREPQPDRHQRASRC